MDNQLELYKKAAELANIGTWEFDLENDQLFWDPITRKIYEVDEDYSPSLLEAYSFYVSKIESIEEDLKRLISNKKNIVDRRQIQTTSGKLKWIEINAHTEFEDVNCVKLFGTIQDITSHRRLLETLEINHNRFYNAFDHAPIGMALVSPSGKWIKVNTSLCATLGYTMHELMMIDFQKITHPDDLEQDLKNVQSLLQRERKTYTMEKRYFHKSGQVVWAMLSVTLAWNADNTPSYFISQVKDITDRIKNTEKLLKERQRLDNVIESTQIGTWEWDLVKDVMLYDTRCYQMLGYSSEENFDSLLKWSGVVHPDDIPAARTCLEECFNKNLEYYNCEYRVKHKNGEYLWIESQGKIIEWSDDNKPLTMVGTRKDITLRKLNEQEQKNTMHIISEQNKRLINFAHIVSHNLRSHAGNFQMMLDLLTQEHDESEKALIIDLLKQNAENLSDTIVNLNSVVNIQLHAAEQMKPLNLYQEIKKTLTNIRALIEKEHAEFSIYVDKDLILSYNPAYMESILLNFFTNAIKYRHPDRQPKVIIAVIAEGDKLTLEIKDNGLGIDLSLHGNKLFGMYKTFHVHDDARGIGLFITKNQIEALGGKIEVESEIGIGTTFRILF
ncbi:sensor histidine kinase [Pedobacter metabolipauper]|uniref:histidine kinase n=1 Tax=Pedobacter metabolipauper TaxID=425513 RepID=A0A4R6T3D8_9SPHI|nr:HAMP domain-containing sensor histidine kinase [Pedobacter metabolipauper]TDQ11881.1 PAS domain S-box-containing protein [Pedobacter metabolipauper]